MMVLSDGERISIIRSAVLIQYTRVMDRRTDRQTDGIGVPYTRYSYMLSRVIKSNTLISQPHSHFRRLLSRHWDRSMSQLLTSSVSWDVGSLRSSRRSDGVTDRILFQRLSVTMQRSPAIQCSYFA